MFLFSMAAEYGDDSKPPYRPGEGGKAESKNEGGGSTEALLEAELSGIDIHKEIARYLKVVGF